MQNNSVIFKYPVFKKSNCEKDVPLDFILFFYFIAVCGIFWAFITYCVWKKAIFLYIDYNL